MKYCNKKISGIDENGHWNKNRQSFSRGAAGPVSGME